MKFVFASLVVLSSMVTYGQNKKFSFKLGDEYELPRKTEDLAFFGNEKDGIVNLSLKKEEMNIVRFNPKTLSKTMEQRIDLDVSSHFNSELVVDFNNSNYFWIHSDWDKKTDEEVLYYDKIDLTNGKLFQTNTPLFRTTQIAGQSIQASALNNDKAFSKYQFNTDADRKKLLVSYRLVPEFKSDKKNYDRIGFQVFDENLNKIWGNEFKMPYTEAIMDNKAFSVDSKGNAYMLVKVYDSDSRKERVDGLPGFHFEVFKFTKDSKEITIAKVSVGNNYIKQTDLVENSLHEMIIACTYSKNSKGNATDGIFLAIENSDGKIGNYKNGYYEFPKAELEKFESARMQRKIERKDDFELQSLVVRDVLVNPDGSIFISCEEYWTEVISFYSQNSTSYRTIFHYDDIYGAWINAAGKFEWLRKIPKRQRGESGRGTLGYKLINDTSGFYFLYLDNIKNMDLGDGDVPKYHVDEKGGQVIVSKIDYKGDVSKELLFDTRDEDIMIYPTEFKRIFGNQFIGRAKIKKKLFQPVLISTK